MRLESQAARLRRRLEEVTKAEKSVSSSASLKDAVARQEASGAAGHVRRETPAALKRRLGSALSDGSLSKFMFGDTKVPKGQNLLQQQLEGEDDADADVVCV